MQGGQQSIKLEKKAGNTCVTYGLGAWVYSKGNGKTRQGFKQKNYVIYVFQKESLTKEFFIMKP